MAPHVDDTTVQDSILPNIQLPYFRNPDQLPYPLPTAKDIKEATVIPTNREFDSYRGHVVVVEDRFVVKYGGTVRENEGYALLVLEKYPSIPAPRLYAMYREDDVLYLVMELLPGRSLLGLWDDLSENEKQSVCGQLKVAFTHIRSISSPGIFGSVIGRRFHNTLFGGSDWDPRITGPFKTLKDLHLGLALHSEEQQLLNKRHPWSSEWFARHLPRVMKDHPSTFTHSDLVKQNIMVQEQLGTDGERDFKLTGIVDWEMVGWYPRYWEYAMFFAESLWDGDWEAKVETFVDPWPLEATMFRLLKVDIEGF